MKTKILALPLIFALGGCSTMMGGRSETAPTASSLDEMAQVSVATTSEPGTKPAARTRLVATDSALVRLPEGAGSAKKVRETRHPNGYSQTIALDSDANIAESHVDLAIQTGRTVASNDKAPVWKPGEGGIRDELNRQFPHMRMQVVANETYENQYGRFGVAIGRAGSALRCVYAWQYVDNARSAFDNGQKIVLEGAQTAPATLRVKLCRNDATVDELVAYVKKMQISVPENYGSFETVAEAPSPVQAVVRVAAAEPKRKVARVSVVHRQRAAPVARAVEQAEQPPVNYQPQNAGPRFMAPVESQPGSAPAAAYSPPVLNGSLPPQAYHGPGYGGANSGGAASGGGNGGGVYHAPAATPNNNPYPRSSRLPVDRNPVGSIRKPAENGGGSGAPRVAPLRTIADRPD